MTAMITPQDSPEGILRINRESPQIRFLSSLIEQASQEYAKGELAKSLDLYDQAVLIDPNNNVLYANRSAILLKLGHIGEALKEATHAIQLDPTWAKAYYRKGEALKESGAYNDAILAYCQAIQANPNNNTFISALGSCVLMSSIKDGFRKTLKQMTELGLDKNPFVIISVVGQEFLAKQQYETTISILGIAISIDSPSLKLKQSTLGALAHAFYMKKIFSKAMDYMELQLELAIQLNDIKSQTIIYENISQLAVLQNNLDMAVVHKRNRIKQLALLNEPVDTDLCEMAELYLLKADLANAVKCFQEALSINPISTRAHLGMGKIFTDQENATLALESFNKAEKFEPNIHEKVNVLLCRCKCLLSLKQPNQALATIKNLTCSFPDLLNDSKTVGMIVGMISECYQSNGDWLQARQYARKQLKIGLEQKDNGLVLNAFKTLANIYEQNGQFGNAVRKCGSLQAQLGNWETAIGVFEERLKLIRNSNLKTLELEADSDLVKVYKKMKDNNQRMAYIESMSKLLEENPQLLTKQEWIYQEDLGEYYMDTEKLEDAREAFERALMLVQEIDHQIKEAELCAALGQVHLRLGEDDEALVYFQQCLTLSQQTRNLPKMSHAYAALGKIHLKLENWDEALECYKYQLTLAKIQNNRQEKLSSLLSMGRVFNKKSEHGTAIKVLVKAKLLGEALNAKQELALCYGYLGECHLAMNNRTKALSNFCKQLSLFSYINDVEGKCETIKHLIEEKKQLGDMEWCKKLCQMRQDVSMDGPLYLRISVLRDSAKSLDELNCIEESIECLETALSLALHNDHNETVTILLDLCACYEQNRRSHKAIQTLKGFSSSQDDLCSPDVYLRLASLLLKTGQVEEARRTVERCSKFHMIDKRFDYALACINFRLGYYNEAMQFVNKFLGENEANPNVMLKKCLVQWYAGETILAIAQTKAIIRQYGNVTQTHQILDDLNIYLQIDKATISSLDHLAKTHWEMSRGNWYEAKRHLISMPESNTTLLDSYIIKFFLEEAIEPQLIDSTSFDSNINEHESSFGFLNYEKAYIETLITMLLVIHTSNYTVEALRQVEQLKWNRARHKFQQANREFHVPKPTLDTIEHAIVKRSNFLYCLSIDRFTLCWIKRTKTDHLRICYTIQKEKRATMPQFYVELMGKILTLSCIESISQESFEYMVSQMETLIGIHRSDPHFEHLHMLMEKSPRRDSLLCETAVLVINEQPDLPSGFSDNNNDILKVSTNGLDMPTLNMIARSRVVFLDGYNMEDEMIDPFALLQHEIKTDLCVLINCDSEELIENLLLSGIKWVIVVERGETLDSKLASLLQSRLGRPSWPLDEIRRLFTRRRIRIYGGKDEIISVDSISLMLRKIITSYDGTTFLKLVQETKASEQWEKFFLINYPLYHPELRTELSIRFSKLSLLLSELTEAEKYAIIEFIHSGKPIAQLSSKKGNVCADTSSDEDEISDLMWKDLLRIESKERNFMKRIVRIIYFDRIITRTSNVKNKATPHELFDLMKSFESKKKWIRKGREKPSLREYCSEGEDQANHSYISDHELTDTESISGAKVLGIDLYEDSLSFY